MDEEMRQLISDIDKAKQCLYEYFVVTFPVDTEITWDANGHIQRGKVLELRGAWWSAPELYVYNTWTRRKVIVRLHNEPKVSVGGV